MPLTTCNTINKHSKLAYFSRANFATAPILPALIYTYKLCFMAVLPPPTSPTLPYPPPISPHSYLQWPEIDAHLK